MHAIYVFIDGLLKITCVLYILTKFVFLNIYIKKKWFYNIIIYYLTNDIAFIFMSSLFYI